jgi:dipeptidyl-peptidase-4
MSWCGAGVVAALVTIVGAQDRFADLPGAEGYRQLSRRQMRLATGGTVGEVQWAEDGSAVLFRMDETWHRIDLATVERSEVAPEDAPAPDEQRGGRRGGRPGRGRQRDREPSPDGSWTAICDDWNVVIESADGSERIAVTTEGDRKFRYGTASWVYGEELDQLDAMWWSPDSSMLAFYEFDERDVPDYLIAGGLTELRTEILREGYPKPGDPNPKAALLIYDVEGRTLQSIDATGGEEWYVYNVRWTPGGEELLFSRTNRHQNHLQVMAADPATGATRLVVEERQESWQANRPLMRFLKDGKRFIWASEASGWKQYELRHLDGSRIAALSAPGAPVESIVEIDEAAGWLYYAAASAEHPLSRQLSRVRLDGTEGACLTSGPLSHSSFEVAPDHRWFIARREAISTPPETALFDMAGGEVAVLARSDDSLMRELGIVPAELFTFTAADGVTELYGVLWKPTDFDPSHRYPLVVDVYGGPLSRGLRNRFRPANAACELGFLVAKLENRGTVGRGKAFEAATYLKLGVVDLDDQVAGVRALMERPYVDAERIGIFGHSYGGYMAAIAILRYPDVFRAAVAGSAVTDWRNYDTIYTERFMRTPDENPEGYEAGSCMAYADQLKGNLLLLHGMVDDNVHPTNVWQLVDRLQRDGKGFDLMCYPRSGHGLGAGSRELRWEYFVEHLIEGGERQSAGSR